MKPILFHSVTSRRFLPCTQVSLDGVVEVCNSSVFAGVVLTTCMNVYLVPACLKKNKC